jgi:type IV secretory pathway VirB10-like protein
LRKNCAAAPEQLLIFSVAPLSISKGAHRMAFNTTSYLAGVGSVVVILSTGFAGGYMLANPTHQDPPNRLQRLAAEGQDSKPAAQATPATKPEIVATAAPASTPAPATPQPAVAEPPPQPASISAAAKPPEPARSASPQASAEKPSAETASAEKPGAEKARIAGARAAERKRADARKFAERQRKQRELEVATVAVRRIMQDRDDQEIAAMDQPEPAPPAMPRLGLFGQ